MEHVDSDVDLLSELIEIFRGYYPENMDALRKAVEESDFESLRETAHQFKGAVSNFYATAAVKAAADLENAGRDKCADNLGEMFQRLETEVERMNCELSKICVSQ